MPPKALHPLSELTDEGEDQDDEDDEDEDALEAHRPTPWPAWLRT
jgi:hypothetical protein